MAHDSTRSPLAGRVALVTGGSRGIGAAIVRRLAADGADVAFTYLNARERAEALVREAGSAGVRALAVRADSAEPDRIREAVDLVHERLGGPDILVNNAGIAVFGPFGDATVAEFDRSMAVHARAAFVAAQAAVRHMGPGGRIIGVGTNLSERASLPEATLYTTSKAALVGLTRSLARELGPRGITVNLVHPGSTDTEMNPADGPGADAERALTALGRYTSPEDVAASVAHLAGPGGRSITGTSILVDAGANA
ncbi:SDR family NAD(P)-dependent oxidoreductase [Nocardiopsis tropica]|uniref:SDR family oxidoreductase n=1 Tax=Nocardiopsis tropica TaxID=109330 RepID=A0ABU7KIL9_9ACTN|nr:SDR family oxidoreductase [Nocardiopsis umidischolae]MEE2049141.1 SDR family oxidoreductase [Nocardiopsis umidischolae]